MGAKVFLSQHPKVACKTDDRGHFQFKEIHNWHYGSISGPGGGEDLPAGEHWRYDVTVSHTNYISRHVGFYYGSDDVVLLKKLGEPSETRPSVLFNGSGHILKDMGAGPYLKRDGIRIVAYNGDVPDTGPWKIHVEFGQRVYDPQVTPVNSPDRASVALSLRTGLDWEFMIKYDWDPVAQSSVAKVKDSSRVYRLTFTP